MVGHLGGDDYEVAGVGVQAGELEAVGAGLEGAVLEVVDGDGVGEEAGAGPPGDDGRGLGEVEDAEA